MRTKHWRKPSVVAAGAVNGNSRADKPLHYVYSPGKRPTGKTVYMIGETAHTFDGECHDACERVL